MKQTQQDRSAEMAREYFCRTQSERILDRHLRHDEKKNNSALQAEVLAVVKKVKTEEPAKELLPTDALAAVLKFLNVESKAFKAVEKIKTLFTEYFASFHPGQIVQTLYQLSQIEVKFKISQIQSNCEEIFLHVESKFQPHLKPALDLMKTKLKTLVNIQTDDQFQLTAQIKDLDALVLKLDKMVQEKEDGFKLEAEPTTQNVILSIKEKLQKNKTQETQSTAQVFNEPWQYSEELVELFNNFEARLKYLQVSLISCMEMLITQYKKPWAKASVSQFMFKVNYNYKHIFSAEQVQKFDDLMGTMQGLKTGHIASEVNANVNSAKIMSDYLKPTFDVSDARATIVVTDNVNTWATRQCGL